MPISLQYRLLCNSRVSSPLALNTTIPYTVDWDAVLVAYSDTATATVADTTPPVIDQLSVSPDLLWPVNNKMVPVTVTVVATDGCDAAVDCAISSITSNEPVDYPAPELAPDWMITGDLTAELRAERLGEGSGRVYAITVTCTDDSGNSTSASIEVAVPHDQKPSARP